MCISGLGLTAIAQSLNEAGVAPLAMHKRKTIKNRSNYWTITSVAYILRYKAVYGEYHPKDGDPFIAFPVIVSKEDFYRAEAARARRLNTSKGRNGKNYTNLFKGIAKCHYCGEPMNIRNNTKRLQFRCKGVAVKTCKHKPWNYPVFELAFLSVVNEIDTQAIIGGGAKSRAAKITQELQSLQGERLNHMKVEETYLSAIEKTPALEPIYQGRVLANRQKVDAISDQIKALETERNKVQAEGRASAELIPVELPNDIRVRAKVAEYIRTIVECVTLKRDSSSKVGSSFTVRFAGGGSRLVHVDYTNPRKPYAITNSGDKPDTIPEDAETALEMMKYAIKEIGEEASWLIANSDRQAAEEVFTLAQKELQDFSDTIRGRVEQ